VKEVGGLLVHYIVKFLYYNYFIDPHLPKFLELNRERERERERRVSPKSSSSCTLQSI
jgi:hypothetical protein